MGGCKSVSTAFITLWCYLQPDSITTRTHGICQHSVCCVYTCDIVCSQTASLEGHAGSVSTVFVVYYTCDIVCSQTASLEGHADSVSTVFVVHTHVTLFAASQLCWKDTRDLSAQLRMEDLRLAATLVPPSAMREVQFEVPQVQCSSLVQ